MTTSFLLGLEEDLKDSIVKHYLLSKLCNYFN